MALLAAIFSAGLATRLADRRARSRRLRSVAHHHPHGRCHPRYRGGGARRRSRRGTQPDPVRQDPRPADAAAKSAARRVLRPPAGGGVLLQHANHDHRQSHAARRRMPRCRPSPPASACRCAPREGEPIEVAQADLTPIPVQTHRAVQSDPELRAFPAGRADAEHAAGHHRDRPRPIRSASMSRRAIAFASCGGSAAGFGRRWPARSCPTRSSSSLVLGSSDTVLFAVLGAAAARPLARC